MQESLVSKLHTLRGPQLTFDFHGRSEEEVRIEINQALQNAYDMNTKQLRIITGRGNHVTSHGRSGTLYKNLPSYIEASPYKDRVLKCEARDGHYILHLKLKSNRNDSDYATQQKLEQTLRLNIDYIKTQAEANNPFFMLQYAELLETGHFGVTQNFKQAAKLYLAAAAKNHPIAMHTCARCYLEGMGVKQNDAKAVEWLQKGHNAGCLESTESLARILYVGLPNYPADKIQGLRLLHEAINLGSSMAMRFVANLYREQGQLELSFKLYQRAADAGDTLAQYNTAVSYNIGSGVISDKTKAFHYFGLAAQNGDPDSQYEYAMALLRKQPVSKADREMADNYLQSAAENGCSNACQKLAKIVDPTKTTRYLELSANAGNILDQLRLNAFKNEGGPTNPADLTLTDVLPIFMRLTDNTLVNLAMNSKFFILDIVLLSAKAEHKRRAFSIIEYMAEQNCTIAMRRLIYFHRRGDGCLQLAKDANIVTELEQRSAKLGDFIAMHNTAKRLLTSPNENLRSEGLKIINQLISKKYPPACLELGLTCENESTNLASVKKAKICYELAITLETHYNPEKHHYFGRIDQYQPVSAKAQQRLAIIAESMQRQHIDADMIDDSKNVNVLPEKTSVAVAADPQALPNEQSPPIASKYSFFSNHISAIVGVVAAAAGIYALTK